MSHWLLRALMIALLGAVLPAGSARAAAAEVDVSLPLGEYYRPGRYLPVRVVARGVSNDAPIRIEAAGAVPTEFSPTGGSAADAVAPLLAVTTMTDARWSVPGGARGAIVPALRALGDDERLVGLLTTDSGAQALAAELFPGKSIVSVPLDVATPLPGPAVAWGALDAVVLDETVAARLDEARVATLLAAGTAVAVRSGARPGGGWPWERRGAWWVANRTPAGPEDLIEPAAYEPAMAWSPGWPAPLRRRVVLILVAFALLALAATLWRSRYVVVAVVALALVTLGSLAAWRAGAPSTASATGAVRVNDAWTQHDTWTFHRGLATGEGDEGVSGVGRPVFASRRHFEGAGVRLLAGADGALSFRYRLEPGRTLAFVDRRVDPRVTGAVARARVSSPLRPLAQSLYLRRGDRLLTNFTAPVAEPPPADYEFWHVVVIERPMTPVTPAPAPGAAAEAPSK
jgi:hypothetical protein